MGKGAISHKLIIILHNLHASSVYAKTLPPSISLTYIPCSSRNTLTPNRLGTWTLSSRTLASVQAWPPGSHVHAYPQTQFLQPTARNGFFHPPNFDCAADLILPSLHSSEDRQHQLNPSLPWQALMRGPRWQAAPIEVSALSWQGTLPWMKARHHAQLQKVRCSPTVASIPETACMHGQPPRTR
jgi:hypothetical protein